MAWDKGFNFRATSGYVADGANETYVTGDAYPTTRNGVTFGWESGPSSTRDRDSGVDRRLAGVNQVSNVGTTQYTFRVDLPATGDYEINLALGDTGFAQSYLYMQFIDNASVLRTIDRTAGTNVDEFYDATDVLRTEAAWPGSNAKDTQTYASTIARFKCGYPTDQIANTVPAHIFLSQVAAGIVGALLNGGLMYGNNRRLLV